MTRDVYEGVDGLDLTRGVAAGPFGDPARHDQAIGPGGGALNELTADDLSRGVARAATRPGGNGFARAISVGRTAFSFVAVSRATVPYAAGGACVHFAQYAPHITIYTPVSVAVGAVPPEVASERRGGSTQHAGSIEIATNIHETLYYTRN